MNIKLRRIVKADFGSDVLDLTVVTNNFYKLNSLQQKKYF